MFHSIKDIVIVRHTTETFQLVQISRPMQITKPKVVPFIRFSQETPQQTGAVGQDLKPSSTQLTEADVKLINIQNEFLRRKKAELCGKVHDSANNIIRLELALSSYRHRLNDYSDYLRTERENLLHVLRSWDQVDECAAYIRDIVETGSHVKFQDTICTMMNRLSNQYPKYLMHRSSTMGNSVDNAICAVEVTSEDCHMLHQQLKRMEGLIYVEDQIEADLCRRIAQLRQTQETARSMKSQEILSA